MNRIICLAVLIIPVIFLSQRLKAQDMIQPGHIYQPGDTVRAPRLGMMSRIPEGWAGVLPRETEMFLLMSQENPQSSIYAFGVEDTRESMRSRWMNGPGLEVENNIKLVRSSEVYERGDVIAADLMIENITNDKTGYV